MNTSRWVYVVERGCYEQRYVGGVYDSPELAMADLPGQRWTRSITTHYPDWPALTPVEHRESWTNDLDWDDSCEIRAMEIRIQGPLRYPDSVECQVLNSKENWDYVAISSDEADRLMGR